MADGILCRYCGWQETEHEYPHFAGDEAIRRIKGRWMTLVTCIDKRGFRGETESEPEILPDFDIEALEAEARGRAAWGLYGAICRQQNFDQQVREMDREIEESGTDEKRQEAEGKKKQFVRECESCNGLYVG